MPKTASNKTSRLARFIDRRIDELRPRRSQLEIAAAAGFQSPNMVSMIKDGKAKLPMDRVDALAKALECDPAKLALLALEQFYEKPVLDLILSTAAERDRTNELEVVNDTALAIAVEVETALRDVRFAKQFSSNAYSRAERARQRLVWVRGALNDLIAETRTAR